MGGGGGELAVGGAVRGGTGGAVGGGWGAMLRRRVRDTVRGLLRIISQFSAPGNNNRSGAGSLRESSLPTGLLGLTLATLCWFGPPPKVTRTEGNINRSAAGCAIRVTLAARV